MKQNDRISKARLKISEKIIFYYYFSTRGTEVITTNVWKYFRLAILFHYFIAPGKMLHCDISVRVLTDWVRVSAKKDYSSFPR